MVPPSMVVSRETDFGVEGQHFGRRGRERAPRLLADGFAKSRLQSGFRTWRSWRWWAMPRSASVLAWTCRCVEFFDGNGVRKFFFAGGDHAKAARRWRREAMEATTFGAGRAAETPSRCRSSNLRSRGAAWLGIGIEARGAGEVEGKSRPARRFPPRVCRFRGCGARARQNRRSARIVRDDDGLRADAQRSRKLMAVFTPRDSLRTG